MDVNKKNLSWKRGGARNTTASQATKFESRPSESQTATDDYSPHPTAVPHLYPTIESDFQKRKEKKKKEGETVYLTG